MRLISIVGARPQFIKLAPLHITASKEGIDHIIINSGQHYDYELAATFFEEYNLKEPDFNLGVGSGSHAYQIGTTMMRTESILEEIANPKEDIVIVYGDTNTTIGAAIAAAKLGLDVAHIEAGVREGDVKEVPEELNRILTDHISSILFPPTKTAEQNLIHEGARNIHNVGDIMVDALEITKKYLPKENPTGMKANNYVLLTLHRPRNVDHKPTLSRILDALREISYNIVLPLHPRTKKRLSDFNLRLPSNVTPIEPQNHKNFVRLIIDSKFVITDSGGTPKEAYLLGKRTIILRHVTGWVELLENHAAMKIDPRSNDFKEKLLSATKTIDQWKTKWEPNPFGSPGVAERVIEVLMNEKG